MNAESTFPAAHHLDAVYDAVLFSMDGVVANIAAIHATAWKQLFDGVVNDPRVPPTRPQGPRRPDGGLSPLFPWAVP